MFVTAIALISVIILSYYTVHLVKRFQTKLICMTAMMVAMISAMMSSLVLGTAIGSFTDNMLFPTVVAVSIGMVIGYFTGIPVSLMAAMDGMLAGIMGGMMGAMLGVMVHLHSPFLMVGFITIIYFVVMFFLFKMINEEIDTEKVIAPHRILFVLPVFLILIGTLADQQSENNREVKNVSASSMISTIEQTEGKPQMVNIEVLKDGYSPQEVRIKAGDSVQLNFVKNYEGGCLTDLLIKDFGIHQTLQTGTNPIVIKPEKPGVYQFECGMKMYEGRIIAE